MKKIIISICFLGLLVGLTHCGKADSDGETIILLGNTEGFVPPLMGTSDNPEIFIPDSLKEPFKDHFGSIPEGYIPPNIEGEYVIKPKLIYSNLFMLCDSSEMHLRISEQHNRIAKVEFHDYSITNIDTAFVVGSESKFTLYFTEDRNIDFFGEFEYTNKRTIVISGEKEEDGIKDLRLGIIITDSNNSNTPYITGLVPGVYFIYEDSDGVSDTCSWFNNN